MISTFSKGRPGRLAGTKFPAQHLGLGLKTQLGADFEIKKKKGMWRIPKRFHPVLLGPIVLFSPQFFFSDDVPCSPHKKIPVYPDLPVPLSNNTRLSVQGTVKSLKAGLDCLRALYGINHTPFSSAPRVGVFMGKDSQTAEVCLSFSTLKVLGALESETTLDPASVFSSTSPAERAVTFIVAILSNFYPLDALPELLSKKSTAVEIPIPSGSLYIDARNYPEVSIWWSPKASEEGMAISTADTAAILTLFAASARCWATKQPLSPPISPTSLDLPAFLPADITASISLAAVVASIYGDLPGLRTFQGGALPNIPRTLNEMNGRPVRPSERGLRLEEGGNRGKEEEEGDREEGEDSNESNESDSVEVAKRVPGDPSQKTINPKTHPRAFLRSLGVKLFSKKSHSLDSVSWDNLAGGERVRKEVEDAILFPMNSPKLYKDVAELTRVKPENNTSCAYIFIGPPGTGKTTTARIVAACSERPLVVLR